MVLALHWTCSSMLVYGPEELRPGHRSSGLVNGEAHCQMERNSHLLWPPGCCLVASLECHWSPLPQGHTAVCCQFLLSTKIPSCLSAELFFPQLSPSLSCCMGFCHLENTLHSCEPALQLVLYTAYGPLPSLYLSS